MCEEKRLGNIYNSTGGNHAGNVYDKEKISPTLNTMEGGNRQPLIVAMRGRKDGQQLEAPKEVTNTLTSVQKDNLVIEPKVLCELGDKKSNNGTQYYQQDRVYSSEGIAMCQPANIPGGSYKYLIQEGINTKGKKQDCASTILAGYEKSNMTGFNADNGVVEEIKIKKVGQISSDGSQCGAVVSDDGLSGTLSAGTHGYGNHHICTKVQIKQATEKGYAECDIGGVADFSYASSETRRERVQGEGQISPTLTCTGIEGIRKVESQYRIRKLTPKECWRLMGFTDEEFEKAAAVNSNTQLYKQAGNSIVVDVLVAIFRELLF